MEFSLWATCCAPARIWLAVIYFQNGEQQSKNYVIVQIKTPDQNVKIFTPFQTKMAQKLYPMRRHIPIWQI